MAWKRSDAVAAGTGPVYSRKSPWQIRDGVDYADADIGNQSGEPRFNGAIGNSAKSWSDRGWADNYADNAQQAPGYVKTPPWRGADFIQDEQKHWYTNAFPAIPWRLWPRYGLNANVEDYPAEDSTAGPGIKATQWDDWRAPDARWAHIPEAAGEQAKSAYARRVWQDEGRPTDMGSVDRNPRLHRTPQEDSFVRQFDRFMGARRLSGAHFSMADHRRMNPNVFGMQPSRTNRNTYRLAPAPQDVFNRMLPSGGDGQQPPQNTGVSPRDNSGANLARSWRL